MLLTTHKTQFCKSKPGLGGSVSNRWSSSLLAQPESARETCPVRASRWPNGSVAEAVVVTDRDGLQQAWDTVLDDDQHRSGACSCFFIRCHFLSVPAQAWPSWSAELLTTCWVSGQGPSPSSRPYPRSSCLGSSLPHSLWPVSLPHGPPTHFCWTTLCSVSPHVPGVPGGTVSPQSCVCPCPDLGELICRCRQVKRRSHWSTETHKPGGLCP